MANQTSGVDWSLEPDIEGYRRAYWLRQNDPPAAISLLKELAAKGSAASMLLLGEVYRFGNWNGPPVIRNWRHMANIDLRSAEHWYKEAANAGIPFANYRLGYLYLLERRFNEALNAFTAAAESNFSGAIGALGMMYANGRGIEKDTERAKQLLTRAIEAGNIRANYNLGRLMLTGQHKMVERLTGLKLLWQCLLDVWLLALDEKENALRSDRMK